MLVCSYLINQNRIWLEICTTKAPSSFKTFIILVLCIYYMLQIKLCNYDSKPEAKQYSSIRIPNAIYSVEGMGG